MYRLLLPAILANRFGSMSVRPVRKAGLTVALLFAGALSIGFFLAHQMRPYALSAGLPRSWSVTLTALAGFVIAGAALTASRSCAREAEPRSLTWHLSPLPLPLAAIWLLRVTAPAVVTLAALLGTLPVAAAFSESLGYPAWLLPVGAAYGSLAALGFLSWPIRLPFGTAWKPLLVAGISLAGIRLLGSHLLYYGTLTYALTVGGVNSVLFLCCCSLAVPDRPPRDTPLFRYAPRTPTAILRPLWFLMKLLRDGSSLADILFCLALVGGIGGAIAKALPSPGWELSWICLAAAATASLAATFRSALPRHRAPELWSLAGIPYLLRAEEVAAAWTAAACIACACLPLLGTDHTELTWLARCVAAQAFAAAWGIGVGSCAAPWRSHIGSQVAALTAAGTGAYLILRYLIPLPASACAASLVALSILAHLTSRHAEAFRARHYGHL